MMVLVILVSYLNILGSAKVEQFSMDTTTSSGSSPATLQLHSIIPENPIATMELTFPPFLRLKRHCLGSSVPGEFFLASYPSIVLHVLTTCDLGPWDLAKLEAGDASSFFHGFDYVFTVC